MARRELTPEEEAELIRQAEEDRDNDYADAKLVRRGDLENQEITIRSSRTVKRRAS